MREPALQGFNLFNGSIQIIYHVLSKLEIHSSILLSIRECDFALN